MSAHWLASWVQTLHDAAGFTPIQALHGISMAVGWQLIHAFLVAEGETRLWAAQNIGETPAQIKDWREKVPEYNPDIED